MNSRNNPVEANQSRYQIPSSNARIRPSRQSQGISSEIERMREEIKNQQHNLTSQLQGIKSEAMEALNAKTKAERELIALKSELENRKVYDVMGQGKLMEALSRNAQSYAQNYKGISNEEFSIDDFDQFLMRNKVQENFKEKSNNPEPQFRLETNFQGISSVPPQRNYQNQQLDIQDTQAFMRTLEGDSKMIPLDVFDKIGGNGNLTLSKVMNYRPSSSKMDFHPQNKEVVNKRPGSYKGNREVIRESTDSSGYLAKYLSNDIDSLLEGNYFASNAQNILNYNADKKESTSNLAVNVDFPTLKNKTNFDLDDIFKKNDGRLKKFEGISIEEENNEDKEFSKLDDMLLNYKTNY